MLYELLHRFQTHQMNASILPMHLSEPVRDEVLQHTIHEGVWKFNDIIDVAPQYHFLDEVPPRDCNKSIP